MPRRQAGCEFNNWAKDYMKLINPHGGPLVNREVAGPEREQLVRAADRMPAVRLGARAVSGPELLGAAT